MQTRAALTRIALDVALAICALAVEAAIPLCPAQTQATSASLQLSISAESSEVTEPFPVRLVLHFHNPGRQPLWLYRPVRDAASMSQTQLGPNPGGSTLAVHLECQNNSARSGSASPAVGTLLRSAGMPHTHLVQVPPGGDYHQTLAINIAPALEQSASGKQPIWGPYDIAAVYSASYANGATMKNNLGVDIWQGTVSSNPIRIQLQPAPPGNAGSISGTVLNRQMQQVFGTLVTLSNSDEHLVAQMTTANDGGFSFSHLPYGRYWVTVRTPGSDLDTGFFEHADLSPSAPEATLKLIMLSPEDYDARQMLHKPVLFRIRDSAGNPVADAELHILWSNGPVMENLKAETDASGLAEINLIPGSNYVTIRKRHCPKQDEMANVAAGTGIDGFAMTFNCGSQ